MSTPTTTGFLVLGLLAARDRSAYEIAVELGKGVQDIWPRVERQLYTVPKRLVEEGLATSRTEERGKRTRTVYAITDEGRTALAEWMATDAKAPSLEFEGMVRVLLADRGSLDDLRRNLQSVADLARERRDHFVGLAALMRDIDTDRYDSFEHLFVLANRFLVGHHDQMLGWAEWALQETSTWDSTVTSGETHRARNRAALTELIDSFARADGETDQGSG